MSSYDVNSSESSIYVNYYKSTEKAQLNIPYAVCEIVVAVCAVVGNGLVITVFSRDKKLRRRTNYYIISLASADLLVGLFAIPFAVLASIGLPTNLYACLFTVSVLVVLCTISIFCLVAVSIDRYWAILYPMGYSRNVRTKTAIGIICVCWIAGTLVGFLPLLGWNSGIKKTDDKCIFVEVMDYNYLVFLYFATIIFPAFLIAAFYAHIYRVVIQQQMMPMKPINPTGPKPKNQKSKVKLMSSDGSSGPMMLRLLGAAQKREVKATQNLSRIVIFFIICWFPLYTINCVKAFCPDCDVNDFVLNFSIILSHVNSVGNPILYAYHLKDFRAALKAFICGSLFPRRVKGKSDENAGGEVRGSVASKKFRGSLIAARRHGPGDVTGVMMVLPVAEAVDSGTNSTPDSRQPRNCQQDSGHTASGGGDAEGDGGNGEHLGEEVRVEVNQGVESHVLYLRADEIIVEKSVNV
ncbi:adenosine receptor A2b isoform X2 [Diachasmimorpha longicaudata]|uniref:adenosine receptor A2b isoform X2 n=1 Tax=Diachasmimorpha longicaudata TaxID=58733 RepID=UPI0030B8CDE9